MPGPSGERALEHGHLDAEHAGRARRRPRPAPCCSARRTRRRSGWPGSRTARPGRRAARAGPAFITPTRSATASASSWSWVTNSVVVPTSSWTRRISSRSWARTLASSADSGSSSSSTCGSMASARASATRCCWPPESWWAYLSACSPSPTRSSISAARRPRVAWSRPRSLRPNSTFVEHGQVREQAVGLEHHPHVALVGRHPGQVVAADRRRCPTSASSRPARMRSAVVLPQPDGPSSATNSPGSMCRVEAVERLRPRRRRGCRSVRSTATPRRGRSCGRRPCGRRGTRRSRAATPAVQLPTKACEQQRRRRRARRERGRRPTIVAVGSCRARTICTWQGRRSCNSEAMVNSPSTRATEMNAADSTAERRCWAARSRRDHGRPSRPRATGPPRTGCCTSMADSAASSAR